MSRHAIAPPAGTLALVTSEPTTLTVALDVGPLLGPLTGIGAAVGQIATALRERGDIDLKPYACSFRGRLHPGMTRLPLPAALAQRMWARLSYPRLDHWLRPAQVLHGTNYTVAPSRLPRLVTVYDCWFLRNPQFARGDVSRAGRVLRRAVASGAMVHASSHATADAVRELLGTDRVEVVSLAALPHVAPNGAEPAPIAELIGVPFILALGTLERRKNLPRLVAAFADLADRHLDLRLVLAGSDGDDREAVNFAIDALQPSARSRVILTGRMDDGVKAWLLSRAKVLAYPSLDEGFGFPLLEAMQHRVPVVASTAGSIPEVAGDAAVLVPADDVAALAAGLEHALTDTAERARLIAAGIERVHFYSWSTTAEQLAALYHRLGEEGA